MKLLELKIGMAVDGASENDLRELEALEEYFAGQIKPRKFVPGPGNEVARQELEFENACAGMEEAGVLVQNLTVFGFYSRIKYFEKKNRQQNGNK